MKSFDRALEAPSRSKVLSFALCGLLAVSVGCDDDDGPLGRDDDVATVDITSTPHLEIGSPAQLTFEIRDADGDLIDPDDVTINFSSSAMTVATVSGTGLVTPVAFGLADITIVVGSATDTILIIVNHEISSIEVALFDTDLVANENAQLGSTVLDAAGNPVNEFILTFTSSNEAVATVNDEGAVTAVSEGMATITAAGGSESDGIQVTVFPAASGGLSAIGSRFNVSIEDEVVINGLFVVRDDGGAIIPDAELAFTTTNEAVLTVDAMGLLTALAEGTALITITSPDASGSATVRLFVWDALSLAMIEIEPAAATLLVAETVDLDVTGADAIGDPVGDVLAVFTSSNPAVAAVNPVTGVVTAIAVGTATVTASTGNLTTEAVITVE